MQLRIYYICRPYVTYFVHYYCGWKVLIFIFLLFIDWHALNFRIHYMVLSVVLMNTNCLKSGLTTKPLYHAQHAFDNHPRHHRHRTITANVYINNSHYNRMWTFHLKCASAIIIQRCAYMYLMWCVCMCAVFWLCVKQIMAYFTISTPLDLHAGTNTSIYIALGHFPPHSLRLPPPTLHLSDY